MNVYLDIETIPAQPEIEKKAEIAETIEAPKTMSKQETIYQWHKGEGKYAGVKEAAVDEAYRKTALDGAKGELWSIAYKGGDMYVTHVISRTNIAGEYTEKDLLAEFFRHLDEVLKRHEQSVNPFFIGHNIAWDLKFIWHRAVINQIKPPFKLPFDGRHGKDYYDNMQAWAGFRQTISQDNLCKALGIPPKPDAVKGSNVWDYVKSGQYASVAIYNERDVDEVMEIYKRINFLSEG